MKDKWCYSIFSAPILLLCTVFLAPTQSFIGAEHTDSAKHIWSFWHASETISSYPYTDFLNAGRGGIFYDLLFLPSLLLSPICFLLGPIFSYNLWIFLSLSFLGYAVFSLSKELNIPNKESAIAAFLAQTAPYTMGYPLTGGVIERLNLWIFPLFFLCLLKGEKHFKYQFIGLCGVLLAIAGCPVYGVYLGMLILFALPFWLKKPRLYPLIIGTGFILIGLWQLSSVLSGFGSLSPQGGRTDLSFGIALELHGASIKNLIIPIIEPLFLDDILGDRIEKIVFAGWTGIIASLYCLLNRSKNKSVWFLSIICLIFLFLSLGSQIQLGDFQLLNPIFYLFATLFPFFGNIPAPWQCLALFSSLSPILLLLFLTQNPNKHLFRGMVILALIERLSIGIQLDFSPQRIDFAIDNSIFVDRSPMIEIPRVNRDNTTLDFQFIRQTQHQQPLVSSLNLGGSLWDTYSPILFAQAEDWANVGQCLRKGGIRYVLFHKQLLKTDHEQLQKQMRRRGSLLIETEQYMIYDVSPRTGWTIRPPEEYPMTKGYMAADILRASSNLPTEKCPI